jgi:hypothetical protein
MRNLRKFRLVGHNGEMVTISVLSTSDTRIDVSDNIRIDVSGNTRITAGV